MCGLIIEIYILVLKLVKLITIEIMFVEEIYSMKKENYPITIFCILNIFCEEKTKVFVH